jgi:serine/threonine-protein kinase
MSAPSKLSVESFLGVVKQSGLIDGDLLKRTWKEIKESGVSVEESRKIADEFVSRNLLTRWQADKLLQGRHKGFFLGKYRLLSHLGSGGMSQVYLAEHVLMRRRVAIKVLPESRVNDSSYLERFHREAQAVAALDHRNIVRAYDVDQDGKHHFLVMEYVPGRSLHELIAKNGPLEFVAAAEYMRQAAEGLHHAHRIGMVHRDIKPGNLLLDEKGTVKLLDLGLARFFDDKDENSLTVKHDEKVLGTADYLSPEQALDSHKVDLRSDVYSLGCTLYYLLTGAPPFPDGTLAQRLMAHQTKTPRPVRDKRPDIRRAWW